MIMPVDAERGALADTGAHPAWYVLAKMRINLNAGNGLRLSRQDLADLSDSPIGPVIAAAYTYGTAGPGEVEPDPRLLRGAALRSDRPAPDRAEGERGAEAMRAACAALADQWRINGERVAVLFGMTAEELTVARKTANGIAAAILALPISETEGQPQGEGGPQP